MSFIEPPTSDIWDLPVNDPSTIGLSSDLPFAIDGTDAPVRVGGTDRTFGTVGAGPGETNEIVLSGQNNTLFVGAGDAKVQSIGGGNTVEAIQVLADGSKIISIGAFGSGSDFTNGAFVDRDNFTTGNVIGETATIDRMAGGLGANFQGYATGGTGADTIYGSTGDDFIRGGAGNDVIFAFGGGDVVRGGQGSDTIALGAGDDSLYYTADQLNNNDVDIILDFEGGGTEGGDILAFDASAVGGIDNFSQFSGFGTSTLQITAGGSTTSLVAQNGYEWSQDDIFFIV